MAKEWRNWARDQRCTPARIERPSSRGELVEQVRRATRAGTIRVAGAGHSFTDIACTQGTMFRLEKLDRVLDVDREAGRVKVEAGIGLRDLNEAIWGHGMAIENLGDIDRQTLAGALATGTHGTGARFQNMSSQVVAMELVLADGTLLEIDERTERDALLAARVSLGALGVVATVTMKTVPAFSIDRMDSPMPLKAALERIDDLADGSDHFEFYVFPHTDVALLRQSTRTPRAPEPGNPVGRILNEVVLENWALSVAARVGRHVPSAVPSIARFVSSKIGRATKLDRSYRVYASQRRIRFTETEYAIPRRHAAEAVERVLEVASDPALAVGFPIEVRFVAGDQAMLSPAYDRPTCYIACHMYHGMPWEPYFRRVSEVLAGYGGRPHWGKRHFQTAATLAERYPRWEEFRAIRAQLDPAGRFRNGYLDRVLGSP